jgi:hypothetical protein
MAESGIPCTKFVVPSIGSTTQSHFGLFGSFRIASNAAALASGPGGTSSSPCGARVYSRMWVLGFRVSMVLEFLKGLKG